MSKVYRKVSRVNLNNESRSIKCILCYIFIENSLVV